MGAVPRKSASARVKIDNSEAATTALPDPYPRYLRLLGFSLPPSGEQGLAELVRRHVCRVPFENVSKLLLLAREGRGRATTITEFLDGIEHHDLGGTCHANNPFLCDLLQALGYEAELLGADMSRPNVHTAIRVHMNRVDYHVDAGYGGPFLQPIRLDRLPHEIPQGASQRFVLDRDREPDTYRLTLFQGTEPCHGYLVHGPARGPGFFADTIRDSYQPGNTFLSRLRIIRYFEDHSAELNDRALTEHHADRSTEIILNSRAELRAAIAGPLAMPRCPIDAALDALERNTGQPFFSAGHQ